MNNFSQQSMLTTAYNILDQRNEKMKLNELIDLVFEELNIVDPNSEIRTELYLEIMTSGNFVYLGHEEWDIKLKHSLKEYLKDPIEFLSKEELNDSDIEDSIDEDIDDEDESDDEYNYNNDSYDDEDESRDDDDDSSIGFSREGFGQDDSDDDDDYNGFEDNGFDEDEYDEYMDDYEKMYD